MSNEITKSISVNAPESVVFKALTDEKELVQWLAKSVRMDARVGGEFEFRFNWVASSTRSTETTVKGRVVELVSNRRLSYTYFSSDAEPGRPPSLLTWSLENSSDGKTLVTLVRSGFEGDPFREILAWGYYLERLAAHCSRDTLEVMRQ